MMKKRMISWFLTLVMVLGLLPATAWAGETVPFNATSEEMVLMVEASEQNYTYTVYEYDASWNVIGSEEKTVEMYEVTVPVDAETVILDFGTEERLAYGYDAAGGYVAAYGSYGDGTVGQTTAAIAQETFAEYVRVQTPYDESWNSAFLYAVHLVTEEEEETKTPEAPEEISIETLMENIAASYTENSGEWVIMDMAAYEDLNPDGSKTSAEAKQAYIKKAIESINKESVGETAYTKAILALTAIGVDAEELYPAESETAISAIAGLNGKTHSSSEWSVPYTLAAYSQNTYEGTGIYEDALITAVLESQNENGSWGGKWDNGIQSTANMIAGLAFYSDREDVKNAMDEAIGFLSESQSEDGKFYDYAYADTNAAAIAIIGLCAAGVNPDTDSRFIKDGVSALDALLSFALADNSGFGWKDNTSLNAGSTEQAFRALIAATQVIETGKAFNIYDFSHNADSLQPGYAVEQEEETPSDKPSTDKNKITVTVSVDADSDDWMEEKSVTVDEESTVYDAFIEALKGSGITQKGASSGYIESMTKDGETLGEFERGEKSGWLYKVNGDLPDVGIKDYELEDGDDILFYYTEDWTEDPDAGSRYKERIEKENKEAAEDTDDLIIKIGEVTVDSGDAIEAARAAYEALTEEQKELVENYEELLAAEEAYAALLAEQEEEKTPVEEIFTDVTADSYYRDAVQWAAENKITSGVTETEFGAEQSCTRGQLIAFIWRMMGSPAPETKRAPYIDVAEDLYYHDAILWATENAFASGTDGISFSPEQTVTRAQAVVFLWRTAGMPASSGKHSFLDVPETEYYHDAVLWAAENGITSGTGDGMFSPNEPCLRGQIATLLYRSFGK